VICHMSLVILYLECGRWFDCREGSDENARERLTVSAACAEEY
jgi:hypothetical protein